MSQSIEFLSSAWKNVSHSTVTNSFQKSGFFKAKNIEFKRENNDNSEFNDLVSKYNLILTKKSNRANFKDFVEFDNDLPTCKAKDCHISVDSIDEPNEIFFDGLEETPTNDLGIHFEMEEDSNEISQSKLGTTNDSYSSSSSDSPETDDETKMTRINMIRHIGDLKLFAAQRKSKEYSKMLLATINQLEKQIFNEPKDKKSKKLPKKTKLDYNL